MTLKTAHLLWIVPALIAGAWPLALPNGIPSMSSTPTMVASHIGDAVSNVKANVETQAHNVTAAVKF